MTQVLDSGTDSTLSPPPKEARAVCEWARHALDKGWSSDALSLWHKSGEPGATHGAVAVAVALLEADLGRWDSVRRRASDVLVQERENPLAGGLAALAAFHTGDRAEAALLFQRHGLFAAFPLVRLFVHSFAEEVRRRPDRYPWPGANSKSVPAASARGSGSATTSSSDESALRPALWRRLVHGGGFSRHSEARALIVQGDKALVEGDLSTALRCFQQAARLDPANWMARMAAALCLLEISEIQQAAGELTALLGEHADVPNLASAAAWALVHLGEHRRALEVLSTLSPAGPDDWGMHYIAALAFRGLDRPAEADRMLRQALGPYFLDTWEQFVLPLFHRVVAGLPPADDKKNRRNSPREERR